MTIITRRAAMRGIASTAAATAALAVPAASATTTDVDAVLAAWRQWRTLEEEDRRLRADISWKEMGLPSWAPVPSVEIFGRQCVTDRCIDNACDAAPAWMQPAMAEIRKQAKTEFAATWRRREALYEKIGLAKLEARSDEIIDLQSPLIKLIESTDSSAPIVVAAKLDLALAQCDQGEPLSDLPQGYICDAVRGLLPDLPEDMRQKMAPIAAADDIVKAVYWPRPADVPKAGAIERRVVS